MIMENLRSGQFVKWVMIIVVATFVGTILFAWGMDIGGTRFAKSTVGQIGERKIQFNTFNEELVNRYRTEKQNEEQSSFKMANLREEIFQQMVAQYLLEKTIKDLKLVASPEELISYFRTNPPQGITQNPYFMTDSLFDTTKYYKFLDSPEAYNVPGMAYLETYHSKFTIPAAQLQILISNSTKTTDLEARDKILASEEKAEVEYIYLAAASVKADNGAVADKEVRQYYDANPDSFKTEGMCELEYVAFPKKASASDEANVKREIEAVSERLRKGESFEALAFEMSEDVTAKDSGDLGYFEKGVMVKPFEDAVFGLKPGGISPPIRTIYGYQIVKLMDRKEKENKIRARHILLKVAPSVETVDALKEKADTLSERLKTTGKTLPDLAAAEGLVCQSTGMFEKKSPVPGFETESKFIAGLQHFGFAGDKTSDVFENEGNVYVFRLVKRIGAGAVPFETVKNTIQQNLSDNLLVKKAKEKLEQAMEKIRQNNLPLKSVADGDTSFKYTANAEATREAYLPYLGSSSKVICKAFALKEGELTPVMEAGKGCAVMRLIKQHPLMEQDVAGKIPSTRQNLADQSRYMAYASWFEKKKGKIQVVNNLDAFYNQ
jgi:parvulin-like peptidyl-prolyl isomerase